MKVDCHLLTRKTGRVNDGREESFRCTVRRHQSYMTEMFRRRET